jgi:hypothetical protein
MPRGLPPTVPDALSHLHACMGPAVSSMMKVAQEPRTFIAARSIGAGIQNLLFADPRTVQDVEECVRATRVRGEPPTAQPCSFRVITPMLAQQSMCRYHSSSPGAAACTRRRSARE